MTCLVFVARCRDELSRFARDEGGAVAIEYAMIAAGVSAVIAGAIWNLGSEMKNSLYSKLTSIF